MTMQSPAEAPDLTLSTNWMKVLRLGLLLGSCGWIISFYFTFVPWEMASDQLREMGAGPIRKDPQMDYWMRMASATFGLIGVGLAIVCARPMAFWNLLRLLGPFHLLMGVILAVSAWLNHLTYPHHSSFIADIVFCFLTGFLIQVPLWAGLRIHRSPKPSRGVHAGSTSAA